MGEVLTLMTNKELCKKYPFLMASVDDMFGEPIPFEERSYENNWIEDIPRGWWEAFGIQMCEELLQILKKNNCIEDFYFLQIKEKFGCLRFYPKEIPKEDSLRYYHWERKYEKLSKKTCFKCGKPATKQTSCWILPVCDSCYEEIEERRK